MTVGFMVSCSPSLEHCNETQRWRRWNHETYSHFKRWEWAKPGNHETMKPWFCGFIVLPTPSLGHQNDCRFHGFVVSWFRALHLWVIRMTWGFMVSWFRALLLWHIVMKPRDGVDETMKPQNHETFQILAVQWWELTKPWNHETTVLSFHGFAHFVSGSPKWLKVSWFRGFDQKGIFKYCTLRDKRACVALIVLLSRTSPKHSLNLASCFPGQWLVCYIQLCNQALTWGKINVISYMSSMLILAELFHSL